MLKKEKNDKNHKLLLRIPNKLYNILKEFKEITGAPITGQIQTAIISWLFLQKMIDLDDFRKIMKEREKNND